jgi:ribonuclease HII
LSKRSKSPRPALQEEEICKENGFSLVAGVDEVGRGCLAGPVVASAVIMPLSLHGNWYRKVRDSKLLTSGQRDHLFPFIHESAISIGTGVVGSDMIDACGMTRAVQTAMKIAIAKLLPQQNYVLIDYLTIPDITLPQKGVEQGDTVCFSIACASIVAKVYRDRLMIEMDHRFPGYGFSHHKGYCTEEHIMCLRKLGPSPIHRWLFSPVKNVAQLSFDDILKLSTEGRDD